jgi:mycofactocin glycosyltransferase
MARAPARGGAVTALDITVVIPTLDRPAAVHRCVTAVLAGALRPAAIVVCDQSRDEATAAMLARDLPMVTCVRLTRANTSAARNAGLRLARTPLVAYLDDDCVAGVGWLAALAPEYNAPEVVAVTGRVLPLPGSGAAPVSSRTGAARRVFRAAEGGLDRAEWAPWDLGSGGNMSARRDALLAVGGSDPRLGPGAAGRAGEDIDLLYRLARKGAIVFQPAAVVFHPGGSRAGRLRRRYTYGRGMAAMLARRRAAGDPAAARLLGLYLRHQGANVWRGGLWGPPETALLLAGVCRSLVAWPRKGGLS